MRLSFSRQIFFGFLIFFPSEGSTTTTVNLKVLDGAINGAEGLEIFRSKLSSAISKIERKILLAEINLKSKIDEIEIRKLFISKQRRLKIRDELEDSVEWVKSCKENLDDAAVQLLRFHIKISSMLEKSGAKEVLKDKEIAGRRKINIPKISNQLKLKIAKIANLDKHLCDAKELDKEISHIDDQIKSLKLTIKELERRYAINKKSAFLKEKIDELKIKIDDFESKKDPIKNDLSNLVEKYGSLEQWTSNLNDEKKELLQEKERLKNSAKMEIERIEILKKVQKQALLNCIDMAKIARIEQIIRDSKTLGGHMTNLSSRLDQIILKTAELIKKL